MCIWLLMMWLCVGCSVPDGTRTLEVRLDGTHPWEAATGEAMPYLVASSDGGRVRLPAGRRSCELTVPAGKTVLVCAYPLDSYPPFGGIASWDEDGVALGREDGFLVDYFLGLSQEYASAFGTLDWDAVEPLLPEDRYRVDRSSLALSIIRNHVEKVETDGTLPVDLLVVPEGRWWYDRGGMFWSDGVQGRRLELGGGTHCWLCPELGLVAKVTVDLEGKHVYQALVRQDLWY